MKTAVPQAACPPIGLSPGSVLLLALMAVANPATPLPIVLADGPTDNLPENVRPIPPLGMEIADATTEALRWRCTAIRGQWDVLVARARQQASAMKNENLALSELESLAPEILVFPRAVELAIEFQQFYKPTDPERASRLLDEAARRIQVALDGGRWRDVVGLGDGSTRQLIVGGYRSKIDGSYQPYGLVVPPGFAKADARPRRLDLWFHGRGETLSEVSFLSNQLNSPGRYTPDDTFVLHPYGRYSNAFKFAGEIDVLEALEYVRERLPIDPQRISVRGFSMGGAACWQFATHYADRWFAANPGAGFSETPEFLRFFQDENVVETAPPYQQKLWQLYDCPPWAGNLAHCPTVAYSGEVDRQKQAADVMKAALEKWNIDLVHIIGPETAHNIHPQSMIEIEARMAALARTASNDVPRQVDFTTVTLRYHKMHWIDVRGLESHWSIARVSASIDPPSTIRISSENVSDLRLDFAAGEWPAAGSGAINVEIDGTTLRGPDVRSDRSWSFQVAKDRGVWQAARQIGGLRKHPGLQGPIDDAFMDTFLFVLPSGSSKDAAVQTWIEAESEHAMLHWRKHFRGDVQRVLDRDLTPQQIATHHLILFGDQESNQVIANIVGQLPLVWTEDAIAVGDSQVDRQGHVPILIHPNPMNPNRYVVLNSGFTFREYDYLNNARQTPKLPDWALVDIRGGATTQSPGIVKAAGFFGEDWSPKE